jgi:sec-independent protein translocase protein TatA
VFGNLTGWHFLIILAIVLLLFGATKLPALARSVGQSMKVFKDEMKTEGAAASSDAAAPAGPESTASAPQPTIH